MSQAKEGMGAHRIDENGYNNPPERAAQRPLALMLGSESARADTGSRDTDSSRISMSGSSLNFFMSFSGKVCYDILGRKAISYYMRKTVENQLIFRRKRTGANH